jgi:uncharacterized protein (DUF362 family)
MNVKPVAAAPTDEAVSSGRPRVAIVKIQPDTVLEGYGNAMRLAGYRAAVSPEIATALKVNISWHHWYPACSSAPWQIDGVLRTLIDDGYSTSSIFAAHNRTVVVSAKTGERANKHINVVEEYGIENVHLYEDLDWITYTPKSEMLALDSVFPEGIRIPRRLVGANVIHLPTVKTHVFTTITGAMKNAFGGLLFERRHFCHNVIHETLVDLLAIQKEIHPGIFAVVDGTFSGSGPGPRCMKVSERDVVVAGEDQVAVDSVCARLMGFDPMEIPFLRLAQERGLGQAELDGIDVVGEDLEKTAWTVERPSETFASRGQKLIYWGPLKPLEKFLLRTVIAPWSYLASRIYHDLYWFNVHGRRRARAALQTKWGRLFLSY